MKKIYIELYKAPIYCLIGSSEQVAEKKFSKYGFQANWNGSVGKSMSFTSEYGNTIYGIWIKDKKDIGAIVHEICHTAIYILNDRGVKLDPNNDEPITYLVEHITNKILNK